MDHFPGSLRYDVLEKEGLAVGIFSSKTNTNNQQGYKSVQMDSNLFREITQTVAVVMYKMGVVKQPGLQFFKNDSGIFEGLFTQHTTDSQMLAFKKISEDMYLTICGSHAFGAGIYVAAMQGKLEKPVEDFSLDNIRVIASTFSRMDAYELGLKTLNVSPDSQNKKALDQIIQFAKMTAKNVAGDNALTLPNLKAFMQVLYNAGVTMMYGC